MVHVCSRVANFALSIARLYSQTSSHFALLFVFRLGKISEQTERFIFKRHKYKGGRGIVPLSSTEFEFWLLVIDAFKNPSLYAIESGSIMTPLPGEYVGQEF